MELRLNGLDEGLRGEGVIKDRLSLRAGEGDVVFGPAAKGSILASPISIFHPTVFQMP